jgi:hypothetical protein
LTCKDNLIAKKNLTKFKIPGKFINLIYEGILIV